MNDYLPKPIDPDTFIAMVRRWLGSGAPETLEKARAGVKTPVFDDGRLSRFKTGVAAEDFNQLMSSWLQSLEERHSRIAAQIATGDIHSLSREAHSLTGTAGTFGAVLLEREARSLEEACRNEDLSAVPEMTARLLETIRRTHATLRSYLSS
jgi:two-component system, sensor histidine kinase and response regulator